MRYKLIILVLLMLNLFANNTNKLLFSQSEVNYLKNNPILKVHNEYDWAPFNYNIKGTPKGYSIEYMNLLASKIGVKVEYVTNTWNNHLKMIQNGDIDVMLNIHRSKSREAFLSFTAPYMNIISTAYIRNSNKKKYKNLSDFNGKLLVVIKGFYQDNYIKTHYPAIELIQVNNATDGLKMVSFGDADGMLISMAVAEYIKSTKNLVNLVPSFEIEAMKISASIATNKENILLNTILNKGMNQITEDESLALKYRWISQNGVDGKNILNLTTLEKIYIKNKKTFKVCVNKNFMPFEAVENSQYIGLGSEYIKLFEKQINTKFEIHSTYNINEALMSIKNSECDILSLAFKSKLLNKNLNFTSTYLSLPLVLATKQEVAFVSNLEQIDNKKIAVLEDYSRDEKFKKRYPHIEIIKYKNSKNALQDVVNGKVFGFLSTIIDIGYEFQNNFMGQLKIAGKFDEDISFTLAVRESDKELLSILNKAINHFDKSSDNTILNKYISIKYEKSFDYEFLLEIIFIFILIGIVLIYRQVMLYKVNNKLKELAFKDQLTNIKNRHYFFEMTDTLFSLAQRNDSHLSIIIIDIDHFKNINDTYGHVLGDKILKHLAKIIEIKLRECDIFARFGGDEFIIALPDTPISGALNVAKKVKAAVDSTPYIYNNTTISLSISMGVCAHKDEKIIEELINKADRALYEAKENGRNQIVKFIDKFHLNN